MNQLKMKRICYTIYEHPMESQKSNSKQRQKQIPEAQQHWRSIRQKSKEKSVEAIGGWKSKQKLEGRKKHTTVDKAKKWIM